MSVIIPTRNRAGVLATALQSIAQNTLAPNHYEVLVIDNGSTDNTATVVADAQADMPNLRLFFEPEPGLHAGRHRGLQEASTDVLVYADDDIRALPEWLATLDDVFADPEVAMAGGNNYPDFQAVVPPWLERLWSRADGEGQLLGPLSILALPAGRRAISPLYVWGCNFSIRRQVLLDAGGFHPDAMPKDRLQFRGDGETHVSRYVAAQDLRCVFDSGASVNHAVTAERMTFDYFRQRAFNQGISDSYSVLRAQGGDGQWLSHARAKLRRRLSGLAKQLKPRTKDKELQHVDALSRAGYAAGYDWHQAQYRDNPDVRAWVHQADYWLK